MSRELVTKSDTSMLKLPPQSIDAEEVVIGAALYNPQVLDKILSILKPISFYKPSHRVIFEVISELYVKNELVDIINVSDKLLAMGKLELVGGREYINDLVTNITTTANVEFYAGLIQEKYIKRELINAGSEIVTMAHENETTETVLDNAQRLIFDIAQQKVTNDYVPMGKLVSDAYSQIEYRYHHQDQLAGVSTGFYELDGILNGLQKSDLLILAARPAMGKTALALNIAQHVALREKKPTVVFSLEMSKEQLVLRMLCSEAEVENSKVKSGKLQMNDWEKLTNTLNVFTDVPIYIDDTPGVTIMDIKARCRKFLRAEDELGLIVIDYLQLVEASNSREERFQAVTTISRGLKTLARELQVPIIALSQLSRQVESRQSKRPQLSDLRESGAIEQDADIVMFIYREEYYDTQEESTENRGKAEVIIAKHRNGPTGKVDLLFQPNITKFKNPVKPNIF